MLEMTEDLAAQIEHNLLPGPLHVVDLREFQDEDGQLDAEVDGSDLCNAVEGVRAEEAVEEPVRRAFVPHQVLVDRSFRKVGANDVCTRLEHNRDQREYHLPAVWAEIRQQPLHQAAVICFS